MKYLSAFALLLSLGAAPFVLGCDDDDGPIEEAGEDISDEIDEATE